MQKDDHREAVCPICNKTIAPYAPERMVLRNREGEIKGVVHREACWYTTSKWIQARTLEAVGADPATGLM